MALTQIDKHLEYWPNFQIHKAKQRLTKMTQYLIRKKRIALHSKTRLVGVKKKVERREQSREKKAVNAAKLEAAIEKELVERLRTGAYGDIYNFAQDQYEKALDTHMDEEAEEEDFEDEEMEDGDEYEAQFEEESNDELADDIEDDIAANAGPEYDFDDDSDDDEDTSGEDDDDVNKYVQQRARKRLQSRKDNQQKKAKKGTKLRDPHGVRVEVEYEREAVVEPQSR